MNDMRKEPCPICEQNDIIVAEAKEFPDLNAETHMAVAYDQQAFGANPSKGHGLLDMVVCRTCGFVQWFAQRPDKIPVGEAYGTRQLRGGSREAGPYRS